MSSTTSEKDRIKVGRVRKAAQTCKHVERKSALKMMAVMQREDSTLPTEFLVTGRTGRRNAMPDILDPPHAGMTTAGLPERLQQLATSDPDETPSSSTLSDVDMKAAQSKEKSPQTNNNS
ncbi:uncharacterized protein LOC143916570 [Arctopsyche grandis]|uniref:uncharacterized protein LOC143916570 n=1 Tax=Arctopsyche grandis TaxID=121162 RepID=UPI00406D9171